MIQIKVSIALLMSIHICNARAITVAVMNVPKTAETLEVVADGQGFAAPIIAVVAPNTMDLVTLQLEVPESDDIRIRVIALREKGSFFPLIMAAVGGRFRSWDKKALSFGESSIRLGPMADKGDGTITVPVTFSGFQDFLSEGEIVNLWASTEPPTQNASGQRHIAPLSVGTDESTFQATFQIPNHIFNSTPSYLQVGYYALDLAIAQVIPLLVYPNIEKDLASLFSPKQGTPFTGFPKQRSMPSDRGATGSSTQNSVPDGRAAAGSPEQNAVQPGRYEVRVDKKTGRLIQVPGSPSR